MILCTTAKIFNHKQNNLIKEQHFSQEADSSISADITLPHLEQEEDRIFQFYQQSS
jgi:hypothetical protein